MAETVPPKWNPTLWPDKTVIYEFGGGMSKKKQKKVEREMKYITRKTGIKFQVKRKQDVHYAKITSTFRHGRAAVGMQGSGEQVLEVGRSCKARTIKHELCHTIGLQHEHQRPDRDQYVKVNMENVEKEYLYAFEKRDFDTYGVPYDHHSIMHYWQNAFGTNTLEHRNRKLRKMSGNLLTKFDVLKIKSMYAMV